MKGYEDIVATLAILTAVLVGGYVYLNSQVIQQKKQHVIKEKAVVTTEKHHYDEFMFEHRVKTTE